MYSKFWIRPKRIRKKSTPNWRDGLLRELGNWLHPSVPVSNNEVSVFCRIVGNIFVHKNTLGYLCRKFWQRRSWTLQTLDWSPVARKYGILSNYSIARVQKMSRDWIVHSFRDCRTALVTSTSYAASQTFVFLLITLVSCSSDPVRQVMTDHLWAGKISPDILYKFARSHFTNAYCSWSKFYKFKKYVFDIYFTQIQTKNSSVMYKILKTLHPG
jgi:hypothetical protein